MHEIVCYKQCKFLSSSKLQTGMDGLGFGLYSKNSVEKCLDSLKSIILCYLYKHLIIERSSNTNENKIILGFLEIKVWVRLHSTTKDFLLRHFNGPTNIDKNILTLKMRKHNSSSIGKAGVSNLNNIDFKKGLKTCRRLVVLMEIKEELRERAMMSI